MASRLETVGGNRRPRELDPIQLETSTLIFRSSSRASSCGGEEQPDQPGEMNLGPSHVVVRVVIRGFETSRNRSNGTLKVPNRSQKPSKTVSVDETAWISGP